MPSYIFFTLYTHDYSCIYIYIHSLHSISMIQIISWNCVDILDVCVECVLPSSHRLTSKTCLCLSDADFLQQKCLLALEVEHPIGHYFLDCSAWPRPGLRTKDMAAWCNTLWSWCRLKKIIATYVQQVHWSGQEDQSDAEWKGLAERPPI